MDFVLSKYITLELEDFRAQVVTSWGISLLSEAKNAWWVDTF
ncbi:hypothetical protein SDC9_188225 [bioreactor metagenome]|uniref:Uncharacterized protein n=1 Tax=bioreactor metagenome TaxID=1076179 RepID=A0A645HP13_9ZZZZ